MDFLVDLAAAGLEVLVVVGLVVAGLEALALAAGLTPAALAILASADLRREAVFFDIKSFLTALSYSDWAALRASEEGLALKALKAVLIAFLMAWL